jgi:transmembrane sensor
MSAPSSQISPEEAIRRAAARWTIRRDRGLSSAESINYELWLAADPRHAAAMLRSTGAWSRLDHLNESAAMPVLAAATRRRSFWRRTVTLGSLAAAAALAFGLFIWSRPAPVAPPLPLAFTATNSARTVTLSDGSVVQLNTGSEVVEQFTAAARQVSLTRGEAHFAVTKNPARPFIVRAGNVDVRAVGTAFNVHLQSAAVDVLVTEGRVSVSEVERVVPSALLAATAADPTRGEQRVPPTGNVLSVNERAVVSLTVASSAAAKSAVVVTTATPEEISRTLAWQAPLLRLGGATLAELILEFQRRSGQRVILADPALASLRVGGRFRADDLDGFTHLLATTMDLDVEHTDDGTLVLRKKKLEAR